MFAIRCVHLAIALALAASSVGSQVPANAADREEDKYVRSVLIKMQRDTKDYVGSGLLGLHKKDAASLLRFLPLIEVPWVAQQAGFDLVAWDIRESIPVLVGLLGRDRIGPAVAPVLGRWGWMAIADLLQRVDHGSFRGRLEAAQILTGECRERPEDKRLTALYLKLSLSESSEFRRTALGGIGALAYRIDGWMEMTHPATMDNAAAFERLLEMTSDSDGEVARAATYAVHVWLWSRNQGVVNNPGFEPRPDIFSKAESDSLSILVQKGATAYDRAAALALLHRAWSRPRFEFVAALSDSDSLVRRIAVTLLKGHLSMEFLPNIAKVAKNGSDGSRYSAAVVLGWSYFPAALDILRPMLGDSNLSVRGAAREAIDRIEGGKLRGG
jgi:hypothetical protein